MKLDSRRKKWNIVLNVPKNMSVDFFESQLNSAMQLFSIGGCFYAWIKHDKDFNEKGELKTLHYHVVLILPAVKRCSTIMYKIEDYMKIPVECIQIEEVLDINASIQYLIHKNDEDKHQYHEDDIHTNLLGSQFKEYMSVDCRTQVTPSLLFDLIDMGYSNAEIIFVIGLGNYTQYRSIISDLRVERNSRSETWEKVRLLSEKRKELYHESN